MCYETLVRSGAMKLEKLVGLMSSNPASILNVEGGSLSEGANADFVLIDEKLEWNYEKGFCVHLGTFLFGTFLC